MRKSSKTHKLASVQLLLFFLSVKALCYKNDESMSQNILKKKKKNLSSFDVMQMTQTALLKTIVLKCIRFFK